MHPYIYFFLVILASAGGGIGLAKWVNLLKVAYAGPLVTILLTISFFVIGIGGVEITLLTLSLFQARSINIPPVPRFLLYYKSPSHVLVKKSILYINVPNGEFMTLGNKVSVNRLGFREINFNFKKPKGVYRILVFGSSYTFGQSISVDHRYSNQLEDLLNEKSDSIRFQVLNFGMPGYNYDQIFQLMKVILAKVECDLIILGIPGNELAVTTQKRLTQMTNLGKATLKAYSDLNIPLIFQNQSRNLATIPNEESKKISQTISWIKKTLIYKEIENRTKINEDSLLPTPERWGIIFKEIKGMNRLVKNKGLPPILSVLLYRGSDVKEQNDFLYPKGDLAKNIRLLQFLGKEIESIGFDLIDPLPLFKKYSGMSMAASEWDPHPNYLANYLYAKSINTALISKLSFIQ
jgi:hypothetical protein